MTNEERQQAIEWLKGRPITMPGAKKMFALAVEALEAYVPDINVGDMISRRSAKLALCKAVHKDKPIPCNNQTASCLWSGTRVCDYAREIDALPPVQSVIPIDWIESYAQMMVDDDRPIFAENILKVVDEWKAEQATHCGPDYCEIGGTHNE